MRGAESNRHSAVKCVQASQRINLFISPAKSLCYSLPFVYGFTVLPVAGFKQRAT